MQNITSPRSLTGRMPLQAAPVHRGIAPATMAGAGGVEASQDVGQIIGAALPTLLPLLAGLI